MRPLAAVAACALGASVGWNVTNVGAIASEAAEAYGISLVAIGLFTTALFVAHLSMQIPGGKASDRFGTRRIGLLGLLVIAAGNAVALIEPAPALGLAARLITGLGTGLAFIAGVAYVRASGGSTFLQGLFGGVSLAGGGLALAVVPQFVGTLGWRSSYWTALAVALGTLALLAMAPAARMRPAAPRREGRRASLLRDPRLHRLAILYAASFGLSAVVANWVVEMLQRHSGVGIATAGVIGAITLLLPVITRPLGGWILHAHPRRARAAVGASVAAGALGTLALLAAQPLWLAAVGGALLGLGAGIPFSPSFTGAAVTRPDAPAAAAGLVNSAAALTVVVGTPLLGLSFSLPGDGRIGFAVVAVLWLLALATLPSARTLGATPGPAA